MAPPANIWKFKRDLWGNRTPVVATLEAAAGLETKIGTLLIMSGGQVAAAGGGVDNILGLALEATSAALLAGAPIKVALLAPGMEIEGVADADATALAGFANKLTDLNADGSLDVADVAGGAMSVHYVENAGLRVFCTINSIKFAAG